MLVKEILKITRGRLLSGGPDSDIAPSKISTDSRAVKKEDFFVALKGPRFDGNKFADEALKKGAIGALVHSPQSIVHRKIVIKVDDTTKALQQIAAAWRLKFDIPVIAVTGSNGKTTAKDMIWSVLSAKYNVLRNEGTENNHIGVPKTLLNLNGRCDIAVLELGTNHKGEIKLLADIARPEIAVITNIGESHLEFLGDKDGVFREKIDLLGSLDERRGTAILNGDDECLSGIKAGRPRRVVRFGFKEGNDFRARLVSVGRNGLRFRLNGAAIFQLNLLGVHNIYNALAAIAVARQFGVDYGSIKESLFDYRPGGMRLRLERVAGVDIINDSYNSNPLSMKAALEALKSYPAKSKWVVAGDMLELGRFAALFHKIVGESIAMSGAEGLVTFGRLSRHTLSAARQGGMKRRNLWHCSTHGEVARVLRKVVRKGDAVLLKGSRALKMEKVLEKLKA